MLLPSHLSTLALGSAVVSLVRAQAFWPENQVNTTICKWQQFRAAVIRDTVYLDGGSLWWIPGLDDGQYGQIVSDRNPLGLVYSLNFSKPFDTKDNITSLFKVNPKIADGQVVNNLAPNAIDGAMLANDDQFILYGGLERFTDGYDSSLEKALYSWWNYWGGPERDGFKPGPSTVSLDHQVSRYIAFGGAANAPSEDKAFYFSGLRSQSGGPIYEVLGNMSREANNISDTLIIADMQNQAKISFKNLTLPSSIPGRANPELVWVPVGEQGILVALGGVVYPDWDNPRQQSRNEAESKRQSPSFMSKINVYDIASDEWYTQETTDGPSQLTRGCAVVATAPDASSFNIYHYGGYDGLKSTNPYNDDVWVLSLPSFTWTKLVDGNGPGRSGHKCVKPYPNQMMVIGGALPVGNTVNHGCLPETIRVLNLNTGQWQDRYDPEDYAEYSVPDAVAKTIGKAKEPKSGWDDDDLGEIFATAYDANKIKTYYPYHSEPDKNDTNPDQPPPFEETDDGGGGVPKYLPPVLGVVLGLILLTMIAVLVLLWRRRKLFKANGSSDAGTEDTNGHRIMSWMRGQTASPEAKSPPTVTTTDYTAPGSPDRDLENASTLGTATPQPPMSMAEMMNTEIRRPAELMDTSAPAELHDTGLNHVDILNRHSRLGLGQHESPAVGNGSLNDSSFYSGATATTHQIDHASSLSSPSPAHGITGHAPHFDYPYDKFRPDSDLIPQQQQQTSSPREQFSPSDAAMMMASSTTQMGTTGTSSSSSGRPNAVVSGISNLSERDRTHLRQVSDTTISSVTSGGGNEGGGRVVSMSSGFGPVPEHYSTHQQQQQQQYEQGSFAFTQQQPQQVLSPVTTIGSGMPTPAAVSPPVGTDGSGAVDYITARPVGQQQQQAVAGSPLATSRRSIFHESREDMTDLPPGLPGQENR